MFPAPDKGPGASLPVAEQFGADDPTYPLSAADPPPVARIFTKAKEPVKEVKPAASESYDLPMWVWVALGVGCLLPLLVGLVLLIVV